VIRRAVGADLDQLLGLAREYCLEDRHAWDPDRAKAGFGPLLEADTHGIVWVAEEDSAIFGYAVVTWSWSIESGGRDALLDEIYVRDRGGGVGSELIAGVIDDCRARGIPRIFLETELHNEGARRLYRRHGFGAEDSVWMVRDL
jgi:ribosomal protein S18 acetylase RimI-like enzyme